MSLDSQSLETAVLRLMKELAVARDVKMDEVRSRWSTAYHTYASKGVAGAGGKPTLTKTLVGSKLTGGKFTSQLASGIEAYWTAAVWAPDPTFTYAPAGASGLGPLLEAEFKKNSTQSCTVETAARRIAQALHSYTTKMVRVTATNIQSGATSPVLVT